MEHTKTPWAVSNSGGRIITGGMRHPQTICTLETVPLKISPEIEANADFIVTACNAHDDLVAAAELVINRLNDSIAKVAYGAIKIGGMRTAVYRELEQALAKARGE